MARGRLDREAVQRAAVALADASGLEAVTMRRLGQELGVEAMSLYHHVPRKDALLDLMVDAVFAEIVVPLDTGWRAAMHDRAVSARAAMRRHRWANGLLESRTTPGAATLRHHDAVLGVLRRAGFSVVLAGHAYSVLDSYVFGFAGQEASLPFQDDQGAAEVAAEIFQGMVPQDFPYLAEFAIERAMQPGYDYGDEFGWGLELVLDGLERALAAENATQDAVT